MQEPTRPFFVSTHDIKQALMVARAHIKSGGSYICIALPNTPAGNYLREFIAYHLGGYFETTTSWLRKNVLDGDVPKPSEQRKYRLRWIDYMLDQ